MNRINFSLLQELYHQSLKLKNMEMQFRKLKDKYTVNFTFDPQSKVLAEALRINSNAQAKSQHSKVDNTFKTKQSFENGQLKIFLWVIAIYCQLKGLQLNKLTQNNFIDIQCFFPCRTVSFVRYKIDSILHGTKDMKKKAKQWTTEEDELLAFCVKSLCVSGKSDPKWGDVSYQLYVNSQGTLFKTFQDCKERWNNHLNPSIKKRGWTDEEDYQLLLEAVNSNFMWAQVCTELKGTRTQHMIKNRFKSLYNFYCKRFNETNKKKLMKRVLTLLESRIQLSTNKKEEIIQITEEKMGSLSEEKIQNQIFDDLIMRDPMEDVYRCESVFSLQQYENNRMKEDKFLTEIYSRQDKMEDQQKEIEDHRSTNSDQDALKEGTILKDIFSYMHNESLNPVFYPNFMEMDESFYLNDLNMKMEARNCEKFFNDYYNIEYP